MRPLNSIFADLKNQGFVVFLKIENKEAELVCTKNINKIEFLLFDEKYRYLPSKMVKYLGVEYANLHEI